MKQHPQIQSLYFPALILFSLCVSAHARDKNILYPIDRIEQLLSHESVRVERPRGARFKDDEAKRVLMVGEDQFFIYAN